MQEEIEHKTVNFAISTTKLSARTLLHGMQFLLRQYDKHASQGKQSMKRLVRQNRGVTNVEIQKTGMDVGPLFGLFLQSFLIGITMRILSIVIFVIVYGRMIEIYMMVSLAPVPMATWGNHEQSHVGQNYLKSLFALGFQGFLILICVAIYAVLIQNIAISGDAIGSIWSIVGYTVLLCFSLFKTSSVAKTLLGAH